MGYQVLGRWNVKIGVDLGQCPRLMNFGPSARPTRKPEVLWSPGRNQAMAVGLSLERETGHGLSLPWVTYSVIGYDLSFVEFSEGRDELVDAVSDEDSG
ncbi:hypothetical protein FUAX_54700 (plasmid) [Fulvitalea axinellae]|uniref:Uncharacterized protein n=1 Tax=Fulvitalea axinellae TaxID=1182444 RepID=A0AAU9CYK6_9BACT|nr:hypothetical protein FUAX_54700 [Fulvitalea axinellae]